MPNSSAVLLAFIYKKVNRASCVNQIVKAFAGEQGLLNTVLHFSSAYSHTFKLVCLLKQADFRGREFYNVHVGQLKLFL